MQKIAVVLLVASLLLTGCQNSIQHPPSGDSTTTSNIVGHEENQDDLEANEPSYVSTLVKEKIESLSLDDKASEEKVRLIYSHLISNVYFADPVGLDVWRYKQNSTRPISFLENRSLSPLLFDIGSCEDFAAVMVLLLKEAGFSAEYVAGFTISVDGIYIDHAWAVVELEGHWYHLDPQLEQNVVREDNLRYRYYLKTDDEMIADHRWGENLISYWPHMPEEEKTQIQEKYTPPICNTTFAQLETILITLPERPNMEQVAEIIATIKKEAEYVELSPMTLHVEPPILVHEHHITPPLFTKPSNQTIFRYGKSFLNLAETDFYQLLVQRANVVDTTVVKVPPNVSLKEAKNVIDLFESDYPEYYWADYSILEENNGYQLLLEISNELSEETLLRQREQLEVTALSIINRADKRDDFNLSVHIYDTLARGTSYDTNLKYFDSNNAYGVVVDNMGFCNGFAKALQYVNNLAGLDTIYIRGSSYRSITHAWNATKMENEWYYMDLTWDRPIKYGDLPHHSFYGMTSGESAREREWDNTQYPELPESDAYRLNYYRAKDYGIYAEEYKENPDKTKELAEVFIRQLKTREISPDGVQRIYLEIRIYGDKEAYYPWKDYFIQQIFPVLREMEQIAKEEGLPFAVRSDQLVTCSYNDSVQVLTFYPYVTSIKEADR